MLRPDAPPRRTAGLRRAAATLPARLLVGLLTCLGLCAAAWSATEASPAAASAAGYSEQDVKAAFLYHFATYVEWPPEELAEELAKELAEEPSGVRPLDDAPQGSADPARLTLADEAAADSTARSRVEPEPISFAVLGARAIAARLKRFAAERHIGGRPVEVHTVDSVKDARGHQVLFIGAEHNARLPELLGQVSGATLVVTDSPDGIPSGGMINFQLVDRRVRFEVALPTARKAGLNLSSRLLSAALRVEMSRCHDECGHDNSGLLMLGLAPMYDGSTISRRWLRAQNRQSRRNSTLRST